jgi:hypothetical protein
MKMELLFLVLSTAAASAQPNTCGGLTSVTDGAKAFYPPIARAAHVSGMMILLVSFKTTGETDAIKVVSGPPMLRQGAIDYVNSWKTNTYTGPRTCPIVVVYQLSGGTCDYHTRKDDFVEKPDIQHPIIHGETLMLCDPSGTLGKRKRKFLLF